MRKKAFTLAESLLSLLIVASVSMATVYIIGAFEKAKLQNNRRLLTLLEISGVIEEIKANPALDSILDLKDEYGDDFEIKIVAIGRGEIVKGSDGTTSIAAAEEDTFSRETLKNNIYRIAVTKDNQSLTAIIYSG